MDNEKDLKLEFIGLNIKRDLQGINSTFQSHGNVLRV